MVYFASDFHLGVDGNLSSREREKQIVSWLESIREDAEALYLLGDIFDYWFEYRQVIPKGFVRLLGKLAEMRDDQIPIYFFTGNHDMWMFKYFEEEFGIPTYRQPIIKEIKGKTFLLGHGDGLGPGDHGYKMIKRVFANRWCQWLFARLHPNLGIRIMRHFSRKSRSSTDIPEFLGPDREWLIQYCNRKLDQQHIDYFIFGHRHIPIAYTLKNGISKYYNLGDWLISNSYAVYDGQTVRLAFYQTEPQIFPIATHES